MWGFLCFHFHCVYWIFFVWIESFKPRGLEMYRIKISTCRHPKPPGNSLEQFGAEERGAKETVIRPQRASRPWKPRRLGWKDRDDLGKMFWTRISTASPKKSSWAHGRDWGHAGEKLLESILSLSEICASASGSCLSISLTAESATPPSPYHHLPLHLHKPKPSTFGSGSRRATAEPLLGTSANTAVPDVACSGLPGSKELCPEPAGTNITPEPTYWTCPPATVTARDFTSFTTSLPRSDAVDIVIANFQLRKWRLRN